MSWEVIDTNPEYKMFRLNELEKEQDEDRYITEEELELIEQINKNGYIRISGVV